MMPARADGVGPLNIPTEDLERCHGLVGVASWRLLTNRRVFVTGGTGFVGKWLLATLLHANEALGLNCEVTVLSRHPEAFVHAWPQMADQVAWITGDVRDFDAGNASYDVILHAATDVVAQSSPRELFSVCLEGTRRVLELARKSGARELLLVSSGAVYGPIPPSMTHVPETHLGGPDPLSADSAYAEGKRVSEWWATQSAHAGLAVKIARIFAVVGPHLPLDKHFAIGNFLRSALQGEDIVLQGDGTAHRSYLYASDMAAWLWAVLLRGQSARAYNVGAEESVSLLELANRVSNLLTSGAAQVRALRMPQPGQIPQHYVPASQRIQTELELPVPMSLDEALRRTARWYRQYGVLSALSDAQGARC
ncbi:NAD-dependent epimerase/dehydratase family protein [Rhodoferax sp.]|jgi:nucleoside-diphosphate-sugar epimerase|uniref:NAD-dependent epimerase/dehydratase family protein n=1 Tax=Rhodoferax sp. TaxID=50421 RepID=UPI00378493BE